MNAETHTLSVVEIPLPGGCTLRAGLYRTEGGTPHTLHLSLGWPDRSPWRPGTPGECLILSADALPQLRDALDGKNDPPPRLRAA